MRAKRFLADYDAIRLMDGACSYCLTNAQVGWILSQIDYAGWKTRWFSFAGEAIDQDWIDAFRDGLAEALMNGCCDDGTIGRYSESGQYQVSYDDGDNWINAPELDPRNQATRLPPINNIDSEVARCIGAENTVAVFTQWRNEMAAMLEGAAFVSGILAFLVAAIGVVFGLSVIGAAWAVMLISLASALYAAGHGGFVAGVDETTDEVFKCLVFCNSLENGQYDQGGINSLLADIVSEFDGIAERWYYYQVMTLGHVGMSNLSSMGSAAGDSCDECGCTDEWCYEWDFGDGLQGWTIVNNSGGSVPFGTWVSGMVTYGDARSPATTGAYWRGVVLRRDDFDAATLTRLTVTIQSTAGLDNVAGDPLIQFVAINGGTLIFQRNYSQMVQGSPVDVVIEGLWSVSQMNIDFRSSVTTSAAGYSGDIKILHIKAEGIGENPFGDNVC